MIYHHIKQHQPWFTITWLRCTCRFKQAYLENHRTDKNIGMSCWFIFPCIPNFREAQMSLEAAHSTTSDERNFFFHAADNGGGENAFHNYVRNLERPIVMKFLSLSRACIYSRSEWLLLPTKIVVRNVTPFKERFEVIPTYLYFFFNFLPFGQILLFSALSVPTHQHFSHNSMCNKLFFWDPFFYLSFFLSKCKCVLKWTVLYSLLFILYW